MVKANTNPAQAIQFFLRQILYARNLFLLVAYSILFFLSLNLAYNLRFDFTIPEEFQQLFLRNLAWVIPLKLAIFLVFGQFGVLLSYFRLPDLYRVVMALGISSSLMIIGWLFFDINYLPPRSVIMGDFVFCLLFVMVFRTSLRVLRERYFNNRRLPEGRARRVAIVGAGDAGAQIANDLLSRRGSALRPVVFLDDNKNKWRKHIHGIPVVDSPQNLALVKDRYGIDTIVIAMPSASAKRIRAIVELAQELELSAETVPSLYQLTSGRARATRIRPVDIEDLLGRDAVNLDNENIRQLLEGKVVLVTGAGGSIGSELCAQIAGYNIQRLILLDQAEIQLFNVENTLRAQGHGVLLQAVIANILDTTRMRLLLQKLKPDVIFHAAAHKHVPLMEHQPGEAIKNNTLATAQLSNLAIEFGVERFIFISTDKAINPTNAMGASKRLAELYLQAQNQANGIKTRFMAVRFGNVLGSSGSVITIFRQQISEGGPITITHPDVTRYFMTPQEAVGLVLQAATLAEGGDIFVLDMGTPMKIVELAEQMIRLSGLRPRVDIDIKFIGLRPGEKLFEEVRHQRETHAETSHPQIFRFIPTAPPLPQIETWIEELRNVIDSEERNALKERLRRYIPEYTPYLD